MVIDAKIKAIQRKIASIGFLPTIKLIVNRLITLLFYRNYLLFYVDIPSYSVSCQGISETVSGKEVKSFDDLSSEDIRTIKNYTGENYIGKMEKRLANNWKLFLAYFDNKVAGCAWVISNTSEFKTKVVPLFDGDFVIIDCWIIPSYRGKKGFTFLLSFIVNQLKNENLKRAFIQANERNLASIKGIKRAGFRFFINYESYKLFGWECVMWKSKSTMKTSNSLL